MRGTFIRRCAVGIAIWLPFFTLWALVTMSAPNARLPAVLTASLIAMGSAGLLGIAVWYACLRWPWPLEFRLTFYLLQIGLAILYGAVWTASIWVLEYLR